MEWLYDGDVSFLGSGYIRWRLLSFCTKTKHLRTKGRSDRTTFFQIFLFFFFQEKQEKQEKQETFPKFGNLTEGKIFGTLRIPIVGKKNGKYGHTKQYARKNKSRNKFRREVLR